MSVTVLDSRERIARKPHRCGLCLQFIEPGERYDEQRAADNGTVATHRAHLRCVRFAVATVDPWSWGDGIDCVLFADAVLENHDLAVEMGVEADDR